jgi:branched-chain amino acid transport system permease protein
MGIIATFGLAAVLDGIMGILFPSAQYSINLSVIPDGVTTIFGVRVSEESLTLAAFTLVLASAVAVFLRATRGGRRIRAAGQDALLASQCGINVRRVHMASWAAAALLAGIAGISYGAENVVNVSIVDLGLVAVPAIVLGGMDSIEGAVIGGIIIGLLQGFTETYLGGQYVSVLTYAVLLAFLMFRPQGLLGTRQVVRA